MRPRDDGRDDGPDVWHRLAARLAADGRDHAARACLRRALALDPTDRGARLDLALLLTRMGDAAAAADHCRAVLDGAPGLAGAHAALGDALAALGLYAEAAEHYGRALAADDTNPRARWGRARLGLLSGDLPAAWRDWDARWPARGGHPPAMPGARWDGGEVAGETILVYAEHYLADTVQFARFVPLLAARGARVVLATQPALAGLLAGLDGAAQVLAMGQPVPPGLSVDLHASLLDLPALLGTTLDTLPARVPYLAVPEDRRRVVQAPPGTLLKVGLAWIGEEARHQVPFRALMALLATRDAAFYSLQTGPRARDVQAFAHPVLIRDLAPTMGDFADLAARIAEMDLVITADSLVAHVAGALGRPVWLLLPAAADPRWMTGGDDSPWYPTLRLFRQSQPGDSLPGDSQPGDSLPGDWAEPLARVQAALDGRLAERRAVAVGRDLLAPCLAAGDLLVDLGPGDGTCALAAAAHPSGEVRVLAVEPDPAKARRLADAAQAAGLAARVEVVAAAIGESAGGAVVSAKPRHGGRRVFTLPDWVPAPVPVVPLDLLLADRPALADRRLVLRLGEAGGEEAALAGLWEALALSRVAAVAFEHRAEGAAAGLLADAGFRLLPADPAAGPFDGRPGWVLALAPEVTPPARPNPAEGAAEGAARLAAEGAQAHRAGDGDKAAEAYGRALFLDPGQPTANANLAVLLRHAGRLDAAVVCCRRALAAGDLPAAWANLGNALRDLGRWAEAEAAYARAGGDDDPGLLVNRALMDLARGRADAACARLEHAQALAPAPARLWDLGKARLRRGEIDAGFALWAHRPHPAFATPAPGQPWEGGDLAGRTLLVRDEGDAVDTVMLARFLPGLARRGARVVLECQPALARLLAGLPGVAQVVARGAPPPHGELPDCDLHVRLPDLPRLLGVSAAVLGRDPYLAPLGRTDFAGPGLKVGLAWSGRPSDRFCPLAHLLRLAAVPGVRLFSLQRGPRAGDLAAIGAAAFVPDLTQGCADFADLADRIAGLDLVVGGDTAEAHLAAAMGKPVWVALPLAADWRWPEEGDAPLWYPSMRLFRQSPDGTWDRAAQAMEAALARRSKAARPDAG